MGSAQKSREIDTIALEAAQPPSDHARVIPMRPSAIRVLWNSVSAEDWEAFCARAPYAAYQQSWAHSRAMSELGRDVHLAQIIAGDKTIGCAQVELRKLFGVFTIAHIMRGPVWVDGTIDEALKCAGIEAMRASLPVNGLHAFIVLPDGGGDDGLKGAGYKCIMGGYHTVMLDLSAEETVIRAGLNGKWRNRLKRAETAGLTVTALSRRPDKYAWLLEKEAIRERGFGRMSMAPAYVPFFQQAAPKRSVIGFEVRQGGEQLGGMLFLRHGNQATYHIGWASDHGKQVNAHNLLMWNSICVLKKSGVVMLDLGGVDTEFNPGIARFKIGTGGDVLSLSGAWTKGPRWRK